MSTNPIENKPQTSFGYINLKNDAGEYIKSDGLSKSFAKMTGISHTSVAHLHSLENLLPGISGRQPFTRQDYEYFRPNEAIPRRYDDIIKGCDVIYKHNGLVRYVIDLMSDFGCQGIRLSHPVKSEQKFYQDWFDKVNGPERSERFLNYLYRHNMVTVVASNATIKSKTALSHCPTTRHSGYDTQDPMTKVGRNLPPEEIDLEKTKTKRNKIPIHYTFLPPQCVHPKNVIDALGINPEYVYRPPIDPYLSNKESILLDKENTSVFFYKKDDWVVKPVPFLWALIPHCIMLDKLNLADAAALDGATSRVRIFQLGDIEKGLFPDDTMVSKLEDILRSNVGGGGIDIIWDETIKLIESNVDVNQFLGEEKFKPHMEQLYIGLGVPPTLIGIGSGTTNNLMSLKTFIQRLIYGRQLLLKFWRAQIKKVQKAMGFSKPAIIEFDFVDLGDESSIRKLLLDMADRNIISDERLLELMGHDPDMEKIRVNREERERKSNRRADKTSPWHDPQFDISLQKIALQRGYLTPEQTGVEIPEKYKNQKTPFELQMEALDKRSTNGSAPKNNDNAGVPGRPKNVKDSQKRKSPQFTPKMKAAREVWATDAYHKISNILKPVFFKVTGKKNLRQLTVEELNSFEKIKFAVLCSLEPFSDITEDEIKKHITNKNTANYKLYKSIASDIQNNFGQELNLDQLRQIQIFVYTNEVLG